MLRRPLYLLMFSLPLCIGQAQASPDSDDAIRDAKVVKAEADTLPGATMSDKKANGVDMHQSEVGQEHREQNSGDAKAVAGKVEPTQEDVAPAAAGVAPATMMSTEMVKEEVIEEIVQVIEPLFVKQLGDVESGYNNSNPTWTLDGKFLGFERHDDKNREIIIADSEGEIVQTVKYETEETDDLGLDLGLLLPGLEEKVSYNAGITWSPDGSQFIYMSNGDESNYDLYRGFIGDQTFERLTKHSEKDGHANWSPSGPEVAFISGRNGSANIYLYNVENHAVVQVSDDEQPYLYPQWSPRGDKLAVIHGSNENHDIYIYENLSNGAKKASRRPLIKWTYDDLRPTWSPDGTKVAFYTNYNEENDPKVWSLAVLDVNSKPLEKPEDIIPHIMVTNVIPDISMGPAWMPDSRRLVFVRNDREEYNPIEMIDIATREVSRIMTNTKINHDVSCSASGVIAFRSQVDQWDQIFLAKIPEVGEMPVVEKPVMRMGDL